MTHVGNFQSRSKVKISFEANIEVVRCLKDLVKHHKMPIADVLEALIWYEHESLKLKTGPAKENEFVQKPREVKW